MLTGFATWYWNPARNTLARCSGPVYAVRAAAGVAPGLGQSNPAHEVDWAMPTVVLNDKVANLPD